MNKPIDGSLIVSYVQDGSNILAMLIRYGDTSRQVEAAAWGVDADEALHKALVRYGEIHRVSVRDFRNPDSAPIDRLMVTAVQEPIAPVIVSTDGESIHLTLTEPGQYMMTVGRGNLFVMKVGDLE